MERRVVVIGKNRLAVDCLGVLIDAGDRVVLAVSDASDDGTDGWQPSFRSAAERHNLDIIAPPNVNEPSVVAQVAALEPDFLLSFQAAQILRSPLIATAGMATLNLHFGPLPRYRGVAPIAWAIINGEAATGVSIHHINPGVDSGELVRSRAVPIEDDDTGRTLYDKCSQAAVELFREAWPALRAGEGHGTPQDDARALYYNRYSIDFGRRRVSWHADARAIFNWIRAFIFPPFQYPLISVQGASAEINAIAWDRHPHRGRPGQILAAEDDQLIIAAPGGRLTLRELRVGNAPATTAELVVAGFVVGAILDND
jgi:methionyl-tRNA formyltransferase